MLMTESPLPGTPDKSDIEAVADLLFRVGASFDSYTSQTRRALSLNAHERLAILEYMKTL